jgi:hypothetical protein
LKNKFIIFHSSLLQAFYHAFNNNLHDRVDKDEYLPPDLLKAHEMSEGLQQQIKAAHTLGDVCLKQAK